MSIRNAALRLATGGAPVFPIYPKGKNPACSNGFKDATKDIDTLNRWWSRNPEYNLAIPTGSPSGFVVLDFDSPQIAHTILKQNGWDLPDTLVSQTGRGEHYFYRIDPEKPNIGS